MDWVAQWESHRLAARKPQQGGDMGQDYLNCDEGRSVVVEEGSGVDGRGSGVADHTEEQLARAAKDLRHDHVYSAVHKKGKGSNVNSRPRKGVDHVSGRTVRCVIRGDHSKVVLMRTQLEHVEEEVQHYEAAHVGVVEQL
jgi:hypothetical protein